MDIMDTDLEKINGGAEDIYEFVCPYCGMNVKMQVADGVATCLNCGKTVLDLNTVNYKRRDGNNAR